MRILRILTTLIPLVSTLLTPTSTAIPPYALITTTTTPIPPLQKRRPPFSIQSLYLEKTVHLTMLVPTTRAASLLSDFYAEIHARCITYWMHNLPAPQADLIIRWGDFQLSFVASEGSTDGISWEFIRDFSATMLSVTKRGYTGIYDQGWWNVARSLGVYVGLRVVEAGADAMSLEAVGSSS